MHTEFHGLVGEDRHRDRLGIQPVERFPNAGIKRGRIQHVIAIIFQEKLVRLAMLLVAEVRQSAANQHGRSIAHVSRNDIVRQRRKIFPGARGVHGIGQIALGIDQRAVQVENQKIAAFHAFPFFWESLFFSPLSLSFSGRLPGSSSLRAART